VLSLASSSAASEARPRATLGEVENMILLEKNDFLMGSEDSDSIPADGEGPVRRVMLDSFCLDRDPITNRCFADFIRASSYETEAERFGWSFVFRHHLAPDWNGEHLPALRWWCK
jgi:formylglycine-generating enzyme required for sulfatase activity